MFMDSGIDMHTSLLEDKKKQKKNSLKFIIIERNDGMYFNVFAKS